MRAKRTVRMLAVVDPDDASTPAPARDTETQRERPRERVLAPRPARDAP